MDRTKPMKPFEQWREEDLPEIYAALRKKERAPAPGPEHLVRPCECNAGWEAFLSPDEHIMLKCQSCKLWWLPTEPDDSTVN